MPLYEAARHKLPHRNRGARKVKPNRKRTRKAIMIYLAIYAAFTTALCAWLFHRFGAVVDQRDAAIAEWRAALRNNQEPNR